MNAFCSGESSPFLTWPSTVRPAFPLKLTAGTMQVGLVWLVPSGSSTMIEHAPVLVVRDLPRQEDHRARVGDLDPLGVRGRLVHVRCREPLDGRHGRLVPFLARRR